MKNMIQRCAIAAAALLLSGIVQGQQADVGHPAFLSPHASPIASTGALVFVANTPADTLDVIDASSREVIARVNVGIDPVSVAVRPDGTEVWVSNHVSDSVSVVDIDPNSATHLQVVATIQELTTTTKATTFDEPVGIAFANNDKAYVALSSENQIAVVNATTRQINRRLQINAQDPRAIAVRGDRLYVLVFESNNQTQISGCDGQLTGLCTFDAREHVVTNNNVLSQGIVVDIVKDPRIPDRDLYVFNTSNDQLLQTVNGVGTLLYGLTVDSSGQVYVAQTDARNEVNGRAGTRGDGLKEMGNRAFLNQFTQIDCSGTHCGNAQRMDLEPLPPINPAVGMALATPFAIEISADDSTLVATAAGSNKLFTVDAASGQVLGRVGVDAMPRGIALESDAAGRPAQAWVLNVGTNSVALIDLSSVADPQLVATIALADPTHPEVKRGRIAFNDANASTSGTFSCESCHPDGGTDQLLWVLDTPICSLFGCDQIPPRITMPIRGLRDTAPFHWDGIPGDPYGGRNTANIQGSDPPNCTLAQPESCTRNLVDGGLASTMCEVDQCPTNNEGKPGALDAQQRNDMAKFLLSVPYPPAQRRAYSDQLSTTAQSGFSLFHIQGDLQGDPTPNVCGDCHRMPFWVSTNTGGTGMETPTWRGAYDRWLILPQGRLNIIGFNFYERLTRLGTPENGVWRLSWANRPRFNPVWNMVLEGSTGFAGAFARQVSLNPATATAALTQDLLDALELSANDNGVELRGDGVFVDAEGAMPVSLRFDQGQYLDQSGGGAPLSREELIMAASQGSFSGTLTARMGSQSDVDHPQPAIWTRGPIHAQRGRQQFPVLSGGIKTMSLSGRHVQAASHVIVNGKRVAGNVRCATGSLPNCVGENLSVQLAALPASPGMHFLQVQTPDGLFSNEFIFHTLEAGSGSTEFDVSGPWSAAGQDGHGWMIEQIAGSGDLEPDQLVVYWYVYADGVPVWLIAQGDFVDGRAELTAYITGGGAFPPAFDPANVDLQPWGKLSFDFADNQTGSVRWSSSVDGFGQGGMNIQQIAAIADSPAACHSGGYYHPDQSGHGFVAEVVEVNGEIQVVLAWYVYLDGRQVWLFGQAALVDGIAEVPMSTYAGAQFPPDFAAEQVSSLPWGTVTIRFTGPNAARVDWVSDAPGYGNGGIDVTRLTQLVGHACQ